MSLKYALFDNRLTPDPNDYMAVTQAIESLSREELIDIMIGRGSTVTKAESLSTLEEQEAAVVETLKKGKGINTPLFNISLSISGVFTSEDDRFDPSRHQIKINITPGTRLKAIISEIKVERVPATKTLPVLQNFTDFASDTQNETLTQGGGGQIRGTNLKVDLEDPQQGVFFIDTNGNATRINQLMRNKPSELIFIIPNDLATGEYRLEVRTVFRGTTEIRTGTLEDALSVTAT